MNQYCLQSVSQMSQVPMIAPLGCSRMKVHRFEREKNTLEKFKEKVEKVGKKSEKIENKLKKS